MFDLVTVGAIAGAGVAVVGVARGSVELFDRFGKRRIAIERMVSSAPDIGNTVTIVNLSDKPLMISAWDIMWARWRPWGKKTTSCAFDGEEDSQGLTIAPHSRHRFEFYGEYYFPTDWETRKRFGRLYLRLWLAGSHRVKWFRLL